MEVLGGESEPAGSCGAEGEQAERLLIVIEDDALSREVLTLIAMEAGFCVESCECGEDALKRLAAVAAGSGRMVILADLQMPGICGEALAGLLREGMAPGTRLLAMSGSKPAAGTPAGYDGFLLKPFSAHELKSACDETPTQPVADARVGAEILDERVFRQFAHSMAMAQVFALYRLCLDDSGKRVQAMRRAIEEEDDAAYRRAAHAIKGGCGMVGALELAKLASAMETNGLPAEPDATPLDHFVAASERLGRMLDNKAADHRAEAAASRS